MALRTENDIITEVLARNNRSTTDGFLSDATLQGWFANAHIYGASYKKWPMTEGRIQTTWASTEEWTIEGYKANSIRIITVGGYALTKLNFEDYLKYREIEPNGADRVFTDHGEILFINPNLDVSGTMVAWGQYQPIRDVTDLTVTTIFSDWDDEGNEAIVEKMSAYLKRKEHEQNEAELHDKRADALLDKVWARVLAEQYKYKTHPDSGGMFGRLDVLGGQQYGDEISRDQF
jgi:hypothetical protein